MIIKVLSEPKKKSFWLALGWTFLILFLSFKSASSFKTKLTFPNQDKVVHFMFYFVFVFLWYRFLFSIKKNSIGFVLFVCLFAFGLGLIVEYLQGVLTVDRSSDVYDVMANGLGVVVGGFFSYLFLNKKL